MLNQLLRRRSKHEPSQVLLLTCEHGGKQIPAPYKSLFVGAEAVLQTHRGLDLGALPVARAAAKMLRAPLFYSTTSRLLIDLNRSIGHKQVYSEYTRDLSEAQRQRICAKYYQPYRSNVEAWIRAHLRSTPGGRVLHVSVHSFTPSLDGQVRKAELGVLYDPKRKEEAGIAKQLAQALKEQDYGWRVRRNYPYHGADDGLTTSLREVFPPRQYAGIEVEMNQAISARSTGQHQLSALLCKALAAVLGHPLPKRKGGKLHL